MRTCQRHTTELVIGAKPKVQYTLMWLMSFMATPILEEQQRNKDFTGNAETQKKYHSNEELFSKLLIKITGTDNQKIEIMLGG